MKKFLACSLVALACAATLHAETNKADEAPQMIVEPSATKVSVAKANLTVSPLEHQKQAYLGSYQLKVTPFTSKNEKGTLSVKATDETLRKMSNGQAVEFTGKATNAENGEVRLIRGSAKPETNNQGALSFSVETENGPMVFNTSYRLVKR